MMDLLHEIAKCQNVAINFAQKNQPHPCCSIVESQEVSKINDFQVPEPWSGRISSAPILFISSNPSISNEEEYPRWDWPDPWVIDYFQNRFSGGRKDWIIEGKRTLLRDGSYAPYTRFWASVRQRAVELLDQDVEPGIDYALTEIVHCKSKSEVGVLEAKDRCVDLYLDRVLANSGAKVLVVLGSLAKEVIRTRLSLSGSSNLLGPLCIGGLERIVAFLPHPNAWQKKTFRSQFNDVEIDWIKLFLRDGNAP
jgi:hypothetical protein